jgi:polysaccharide biosynthesis protein PslG
VANRRRTINLGLASLLGLALLTGCSAGHIPFTSSVASPAAESAQTPGVKASGPGSQLGEQVGISPGSTILWDAPAVRQRKLDAVAASGARWLELDIDWNSIQDGGQNSFWWDATDAVVLDARARGLKVLGMLGYTPTWARPASCLPLNTDKCLPASPETYATFAATAAKRYGSLATDPALRAGIVSWQIWNEPNHYPFVQPTVDVGAYTRMLKRAYVEIKHVDPTATVLAGGTAPAPNDPAGRDMEPARFIQRIYDNGGKGYFDAVAHHPYSFPCNPLTVASWNAFTQTRFVHDVMVNAGDAAKKVWGTEAGAPTASDIGTCTPGNRGRSVSEATQSQFLSDYFKGWFGTYGSFTGPLFWYQIQDNGIRPDYYDDHFGLLRRDFTQKPAYRTLQRLTMG